MTESPLIKEILTQRTQEDILRVLQARFEEISADVAQRLRSIRAYRKLTALIKHEARCSNLEVCRKRL